MVDPTSDLAEDVDPADAPSCAVCGTKIVEEPTHRVVSWIAEGEIRRCHFCDDGCREEWDGEDRGT